MLSAGAEYWGLSPLIQERSWLMWLLACVLGPADRWAWGWLGFLYASVFEVQISLNFKKNFFLINLTLLRDYSWFVFRADSWMIIGMLRIKSGLVMWKVDTHCTIALAPYLNFFFYPPLSLVCVFTCMYRVVLLLFIKTRLGVRLSFGDKHILSECGIQFPRSSI